MTDLASADEEMMDLALRLARQAATAGEVPVGAVVVREGAIIGVGHNNSIERSDPSAHAEVVALREAGRTVGNYRLPDAALYVTLEPCLMCVGAAVAARVERLIFGATDPKAGCLGGAYDAGKLIFLNHHFAVTSGVRAERCGDELRKFFRERR